METPPPMNSFDPWAKALPGLSSRCDAAGLFLFEHLGEGWTPVNHLAQYWAESITDDATTWSHEFTVERKTFAVRASRIAMEVPHPLESLMLGSATESLIPPTVCTHQAGFEPMARLIEAAAKDLYDAEIARDATVGLTTQVTDAFETVHFLYTLGRSMSDTSAPERFLQLVCDELRVARNFGWVSARFLRNVDPNVTVAGVTVAARDSACSSDLPDVAAVLSPHSSPEDPPRVLELPDAANDAGSGEIISQPLGFGGKVIGTLMAGGRQCANGAMSSYDTQLLEGAARYGNAFLNACALYRGQERMFLGIVRSLTASIDAKDSYTRGHSERVALVARDLAIAAGLDDSVAQRVHIAGLLHDVGKIGVPEAVLCKQGRLTDAEFDLIKQHPVIGYRILTGIPLLEDVLPGVLHHHERFDGTGYPHRLKGMGIPLFARLLAVADTFDAMSSNRSYRAALHRSKVLDEIQRSAGTQFDPELVSAFSTLDLTEYDHLVTLHQRQSQAA